MDPQYREMVDYLTSLGTADVPHTGTRFLAHLIGVFRDLESWNCEQHVCRAGLFHSIYGTQKFQKFSLPLSRRDDVRELIGPAAELLAFANCFMDRSTLDSQLTSPGPVELRNRDDGSSIPLTEDQLDDLCRVHLCDWLEQVPRVRDWNYRREAYRQMARRLGGVAEAAYEQVFAAENETSAASHSS